MLGRLLQTAANTLSGPRDAAARGTLQQNFSAKQLESNIEEAHTRDLLYPDIEALKTSQHSALSSINGRVPATPAEANSFDDRGGLDVAFPHDVRVLIAQDANAKQPAQILYDSKPKRVSSPQQEHGPAASQRLHTRGKSFSSPQPGRHGHRPQSAFLPNAEVTSPTSPLSPSRSRNLFGHSAFDHNSADAEGQQTRVARETKEEIDGLMSCIFGAAGHRIEPGIKLHILPKTSPEIDRSRAKMPPGTAPGQRRSNLTRSSTGGFETPRERGQSAPPTTNTGRTSIMITKLFNVQLPETTVPDTEDEDATTPDAHSQSAAKAFHDLPAKSQAQSRPVKQKKTPAYAIALIIHLPTDMFLRTRSNPPPGVVSLPSSYQSSMPTSPRLPVHPQPISWMDGRASGPLATDSAISSQIGYILGNWTLISRNLRLLEFTAMQSLKHLLQNIVPIAPLPVASHTKAGGLKIKQPKAASQQAVAVHSDCLQNNLEVRAQANASLQRIARGLRTRRVTPGQSRWGAWREEARSISRWAGSRDQNFFFFVFMSAFLGQHTRWLEQVAPRWYCRQAHQQKQSGKDDHEALPQRTVLVCENKMDARRLIFLAASFMPTNFRNSYPQLTVPLLGYGGSPPALPTSREALGHSGLRQSFSATAGHSGHGRSVSFSIAQPIDEPTDEERHAFGEELVRRASEAGSVRSTFSPLQGSRESRKTSTSTWLADDRHSAQPVPHFSVEVSREGQVSDRPGSSASMASMALNQALKRSESAGAASVGSRLGTMVSGLWNTAGDSGTTPNQSAIVSTEAPSPDKRVPLPRGQSTSDIKPSLRSTNKLDAMVEEAGRLSSGSPTDRTVVNPTPLGRSPGTRAPLDLDECLKKTPTASGADDKSGARVIPKRSETDRVPLQLNMNQLEGFVDVSMPPGHSMNTSLASSFASMRLSSTGYPSAYSSITGLWGGSGPGALVTSPPDGSEHFSPYGSPSFVGSASPRPERTPEVAGWLKTFHPDFLLQAVKPYAQLQTDLKAALEAEARLSQSTDDDSEVEESDEWKEVASILVASTVSFSVYRLILQRRKRRIHPSAAGTPKAEVQPTTKDASSSPFFSSPVSSSDSLSELKTEDQIIKEPIMDVDPVLIDAFERVLAQAPNAELHAQSRIHSRAASRAQSRAASPTRSRPVSVRSIHPGQHPESTSARKQKEGLMQTKSGSADAKFQGSGKFSTPRSAGKEVPFAECRSIIIDALKDITKSVIEERDMNERAAGASKDGKQSTTAGAVLGANLSDGVLREGVSKWLSSVEEGARRW